MRAYTKSAKNQMLMHKNRKSEFDLENIGEITQCREHKYLGDNLKI